MARIPLAEIPRAPTVGGPVLSQAQGKNISLNTVAGNLMTQQLEVQDFAAPGAALSRIGQAVSGLGEVGGKVGGVLEHWENVKRKAEDAGAYARYDAAKAEHMAALGPKLQTLSPDQRAAAYQASLADFDKAVAEIPMSEQLRAGVVTPDRIRWGAETASQITVNGQREVFQAATDEAVSGYIRNLKEGRYEQGFEVLNKARDAKLISEPRYKTLVEEGNAMVRENNTWAAMNMDPKGFYEDLQDYKKTGKSEALSGLIEGAENIAMWENRAASNWRGIQSSAREEMFNGIQSGAITREDQLTAAAGDVLDEKDKQAGRKALMNLNGPLDPNKYAELRVKVAQWNPKADPTGEQRADLMREIGSEMPSQEQALLSRQLSKTAKEGLTPRAEIDSFVKGQIKSLHDDGFWGKWQEGAGEKKKIDREKQAESAMQMTKFMDGWEQWQKENPNADFMTAQEWFNKQSKPLRETKVGFWQAFSQPAAERDGRPRSWADKSTSELVIDAFSGKKPTTEDRFKLIDQKASGKPSASASPLGGVLKGKDSIFDTAAAKYGVDPALLKAIAMHETGNGSSKAAKQRNNPGGLMNPKNYDEIQSFDSLEEGIEAMARNLGRNYIGQGLTTIEAIQKKYAPVGAGNDKYGLNKDWVGGVSKFYKDLQS